MKSWKNATILMPAKKYFDKIQKIEVHSWIKIEANKLGFHNIFTHVIYDRMKSAASTTKSRMNIFCVLRCIIHFSQYLLLFHIIKTKTL